jgi:hypothetical protein
MTRRPLAAPGAVVVCLALAFPLAGLIGAALRAPVPSANAVRVLAEDQPPHPMDDCGRSPPKGMHPDEPCLPPPPPVPIPPPLPLD